MRDVLRLRARIQKAVFLVPALVVPLAACAKDDPQTKTTVNVPPGPSDGPAIQTVASAAPTASASATPSAVAATDPTDQPGVGRPPRPDSMRMPSCPNGRFCSTKSEMQGYAKSGSQKQLDCPTEIEGRDRADAGLGIPRASYARMTFDATTTQAMQADGGANQCCYTWVIPCPGGRPFSDEHGAIVALAREGSWGPRRSDRARLAPSKTRADAWLADALAEHASIASFARTTLELLAVGAPADLVRDAQRAGLDEVHHAELCFDLARAFGATATAPGPLPALAPRDATLATLAMNTFVEGCVGETISALAASRAAEDTNAPSRARAVHRILAKDEARHAELAWRTLAWIFSCDGGASGDRLLEHTEELARDAHHPLRREAFDLLIVPTLRAMITQARASRSSKSVRARRRTGTRTRAR